MAGKSESPPPFEVPRSIRRDEDHELLPGCSAAFAGLEITLKTVTREMRGVRTDVQEIGRTQAAQAESMKGLWHEIRDEIRPDLRALPEKIANDFEIHSRNCPARRRAMKKAEIGTGDKIDVRQLRENLDDTGAIVTTGNRFIRNTSNGHYEIPRPVLWVGALIGAAVAASGYILSLLPKL